LSQLFALLSPLTALLTSELTSSSCNHASVKSSSLEHTHTHTYTEEALTLFWWKQH